MEDYEFLDYYKILEIEPEACPEQIKKAYRLLALMYHPDRYKETDNEELYRKAEEKFKLIQVAYRTLSDPQKRAEYDAYYSEVRRQPRYTEYQTEREPYAEYEAQRDTEETYKEEPAEPVSLFPSKTLYFCLGSLLIVLLGYLFLTSPALYTYGFVQIAIGITCMGAGGWRLWSHGTTGSKIAGALFLAPAVIIIGYVALVVIIFIFLLWVVLAIISEAF